MKNKKSKYRGVNWHKTCKKWVVTVFHNNKNIKIGYFDDEIEGAIAYDEKALEIKGDKAKLNFCDNDKYCEVCGDKALYKYKNEKWLCKKHISQMNRCGEILTRTQFDLNEIIVMNDICEIILYDKNNEECARAIIDIEDLDKVKRYKWYLRPDGYVASNNVDEKYTYLHHLIIENKNKNYVIDHKDRNKLNNKTSNLRLATNSENGYNKGIRSDNISGKVGVHWSNVNNKWCVMIKVNNDKRKNLGYFEKYEEAVNVRINAELKYFKEFRPENEKLIEEMMNNDI